MDIFSKKSDALIHLNSTAFKEGEIRVYRYYAIDNKVDSFIAIGVDSGTGPDHYQIMSRSRNLIVNITDSLPDETSLINGQIYVYKNSSGIYQFIYTEGLARKIQEIQEGEVYYVEDFDTGYLYYLDRRTLKKLNDFNTKTYVELSNSQAIFEVGKYPETTVTVWKDNIDVTGQCSISIVCSGCSAVYDGSRTIRVTSMETSIGTVKVRATLGGNTYTATMNIQEAVAGPKGEDAEILQLLVSNSVIRRPDLMTADISILHQGSGASEYFGVSDIETLGYEVKYEYSNGLNGRVRTDTFEFLSDQDVTWCALKLVDPDDVMISRVSLPYIPDMSELTSGQGIYKSIVFCRTKSAPAVPLGGNWSTPVPDDSGWTTTIPEGTGILWSSTRTFTSNGLTPQDDSWSTPSQISSTEAIEVMYSACSDSTIVGTPNTKPENWAKNVSGISYFMATRTVTNNVAGLWQVFAIHGKDGAKPDYKDYIYYPSATQPETPVGNNPTGWYDYPTTSGKVWWMSVGLFDGTSETIKGNWSVPVRVTGQDGEKGDGGQYLLYQYAISEGPSTYPSSGWTSSIPSVGTGQYLWQRSGVVIPPATKPVSWGTPVRVTGEKGEKGATPVNIKIDLTNEVSSVAADFYGNVPVGAIFETTQVLLYDSANQISFSDPRVTDYSIKCEGVSAEISSEGLVTVTGWDQNNKKDTGSVTINVIVDQATYTTVYTIQKVRAGQAGADATLYKIIPDMNVVRRVNGKPEVRTVQAYVMKTQGSKTSIVSNLELEHLKLLYSLDNEEFLEYLNGVTILDTTRYIIFKLVSSSSLNMYDRETITIVESSTQLTVDLDNEISAVPTNDEGTPIPGVSFEPSNLRVFYGGQEIDIDSCEVSSIWTNLTGTVTDGCIQPTAWHITDSSIDYGSVLVSVSYLGLTKSVVYTIRKLKAGVTPSIYKIVPNVSVVKGRKDTETIDVATITVQVAKTYGSSQTIIEPANLASEGLSLKYVVKNQGVSGTDIPYDRPITTQFGTDSITFTLRIVANNTLLDRETIPFVYDGESKYTYIVYARSYDEVNGPSQVSSTWATGYQWIGICNTNLETQPVDYSLYTWSRFVGQDGKGQEYIFCRADSPNDVSDVSLIQTNATAAESSNDKAFQDDEFLPSTSYGVWTDDPQEVTDLPGQRAQWVSMRTKSDGIWGPFSAPKLWNSNSIDLNDVDTHLLAGVGIAADSGRIGGWQINTYVQNPVTPIPKNGSLFFERPVNETIAEHNGSGYSGYSGIWFNPVDKTSDDKVTPKLVVSRGYVDDSASPKAINDMITIDVSGISMGTYGSGKTSILRSDGSASLAGGNLTWGKDGTLVLTGTINAASGTIGGWSITNTEISYSKESSKTTNHSETSKTITHAETILKLDSEGGKINLSSDISSTYWYLESGGGGGGLWDDEDDTPQGSSEPEWIPDFSGSTQRTYNIDIGFSDSSKIPYIDMFNYTNRSGKSGDYDGIELSPESIKLYKSYIGDVSSGEIVYTLLNADGSGWLARGNFSWDTEGNMYGPDTTYENNYSGVTGTIKAWELSANGSMTFHNGMSITLEGSPADEDPSMAELSDYSLKFREENFDVQSRFTSKSIEFWSDLNSAWLRPDLCIDCYHLSIIDGGTTKTVTWSDLFSFLESSGVNIETSSISQ